MKIGIAVLFAAALVSGVSARQQAADRSVLFVMEFDAKGVLYAADAQTKRVVAIETTDKAGKAQPVAIADLGAQLAKELGCDASKVHVYDVAVHPLSFAVYLSAGEVRDANAQIPFGNTSTLFRWSGKKFEKIDVAALKPKSAALPAEIFPLGLVVTPKGVIVSSMQQDKNFLSRLHFVATPMKDGAVATSETDVYHTTHGAWETQSPLLAMTSLTLGKVTHVFGSTMCTPVVRIGVDEVIAAKEKVKTTTICELGGGNAPLSMMAYAKGNQAALVMATREDGTFKIDGGILTEAASVNEKAAHRQGAKGIEQLGAWVNVKRLAQLDATRAIVVKAGESLALETVNLP